MRNALEERNKYRYPLCTSVNALENMPHQFIVRCEGWMLEFKNYKYCLSDGTSSVHLYCLPDELRARMSKEGDVLLGVDLHVRVVHGEDLTGYLWGTMNNSWSTGSREYYYYEPKKGACDCGAHATSFPEHHSTWCSTYIVE